MGLCVKLETFEGPLDLLLHLIKKSEVDIYNIPISEITDQYMEYLRAMEELDLDIASEFLVMTATLIEIKSSMLLPKIKSEDELEDEDDPRKELVEKLIEYRKYKEFAEQLKDIEKNNVVYFKSPEIIDDIEDNSAFFNNITLDNLMHTFNRIVKQYENKFNENSKIPQNIKHDEYKIEDKMGYMMQLINEKGSINFQYIFNRAKSKEEVIVIFLALLELIRLKKIRAVQYKSYGDIVVERLGEKEQWKIS